MKEIGTASEREERDDRERSPIPISLIPPSGSHIPFPGPLHSLSWSTGSNPRGGGGSGGVLRFGRKSFKIDLCSEDVPHFVLPCYMQPPIHAFAPRHRYFQRI